MNDVRIRTADLEDIGILVRLNIPLFHEDAGQRDPFTNLNWPETQGDEHFTERVTDKHSQCLLAETDDQVIGYLAGYVNEQTELRPIQVAELESMYVREDYRSQGVGTNLTTAFLEWASAQGADRASVSAFAANERAIAFYRRLGFEAKTLSLEVGLE
jgi:ribosomal protein S18 acetylase RimI-like enzyme